MNKETLQKNLDRSKNMGKSDKILNNENKLNKIQFDEIDNLFEANERFKNKFYFENLTDVEFFNETGITSNFYKFYKKIIKSGVGTIILGGIYLGVNKKGLPRLSLDNNILEGFKEIIKFAHSAKCKIFLKVKSLYGRFNNVNSKNFKLASNFDLDPENKKKFMIRVSDNKINEMVNDFNIVSKLANIAGFDGIMIDASLSNLIGELSSESYNKRIFGYYSECSDILNKMLRNINSDNDTIIVKYTLSPNLLKNANKDNNFQNSKEFQRIIKLISDGVDGFEFVFEDNIFDYYTNFNGLEDELLFKNFILDIRKYLNINNIKNKFGDDVIIFYHDNFYSLDEVNPLIKNNIINLIDVTRNIYSDINYLKNLLNKNSCVNCIKCSYCEQISHFNNKIQCIINPKLKNFDEMKIVQNRRNIAVIGSGISGLICAITLVKRGYHVSIFEQKNTLNHYGKICTIYGFDKFLSEYYSSIDNIVKYYSEKERIEINLNTKFEINNNNLNKFDSIILATGFKTKFLSINGAVQSHIHNIFDVLNNENIFNSKKYIVIYAKTVLSIKLALYLSFKTNKKITLIIKDIKFITENKNANLIYYFQNLYKQQVNILFLSRIIKINEDNIDIVFNNYLNKNSFSSFQKIYSNSRIKLEQRNDNLDCDLLIYEPDLIPNNHLYIDIVNKKYKGEVYLVGNALENSTLANIIKSGYFVGKNL